MITCPRCAVVALVLLALSGCDSSNPGRDLGLIEGVYAIESIRFVSETERLDPVEVTERLVVSGEDPSSLEIFGNDETSILRIRFLRGGSGGLGDRDRVDLTTTASRGRATFEVSDRDREKDVRALSELLLPPTFVLTYEGESPTVLTGTIRDVRVNLEAYDPVGFRNLRDNEGTLTIRFRRP